MFRKCFYNLFQYNGGFSTNRFSIIDLDNSYFLLLIFCTSLELIFLISFLLLLNNYMLLILSIFSFILLLLYLFIYIFNKVY